ncbi:MAG TPA: GNAT family N-acetyltransferase [Euzebyales bacterium]|nr:GNAT family N-acetyltransferase [Euzebyales bacterium]
MDAAPIIRPVRADEHDRVAELTLAAYERLGVDVGPYRASLADVGARAMAVEVLVAVRGSNVVGAVTYVPDRDSAYAEFDDADAAGIRMLAVDPDVQGTGVGTALVEACVARAAATGRSRIVLHSTADMAAARRLYRRLGFRRAPDRDWQPQPYVALHGYVLALDTAAAAGRARSVGT